MTVLKFDLDIDAEIQKLGLPIANPANPANRLGSQIKISNPYNELSPIPDRSIHIEEATHLYQKRGWIQIFSGYLNQSVYLVKNKSTRVPDPSIPKYTKEETEALRGLTLDELKTLHEAKVIFKGEIH
tara:strand:+ start:354 stop:737 length:384 start_codon:yes stop_codon:yes gene_type:complete